MDDTSLKGIKSLEQKLIELRQQNELYRKILDNIPLGIQVFDKNGTSYAMNEYQKILLGVPDQSTGVGEFNVLNDPFAQANGASAKYKKAYKGETLEHNFEYNPEIKENTWETRKDSRSLQETLIPLLESGGNVDFVIAILQDVTGRKKEEQQLRELNASKDKLFSIIGHDLRGPFGSLVGLAGAALEKVQEKNYQDLDRSLNLIYKSSQQSLNLLENLLQWARLQTGQVEYNPELVDIEMCITRAIEFLKSTYSEKNIILYFSIEPSLNFKADRFMLETIVRNLMSNAIKFTKQDGVIRITATMQKDEILIAIKDSGVGIPKDKLDYLFSLDESFTTPGTKNEKGTGLGLVLCKEFVDLHGGKIWAESEEEDLPAGKAGGSTFSFTLRNNS